MIYLITSNNMEHPLPVSLMFTPVFSFDVLTSSGQTLYCRCKQRGEPWTGVRFIQCFSLEVSRTNRAPGNEVKYRGDSGRGRGGAVWHNAKRTRCNSTEVDYLAVTTHYKSVALSSFLTSCDSCLEMNT